jgi:hypothetical protein
MNGEKQSPQVLENLLFPGIFKTFCMAIQPSKLIIALVALAVICFVGWIMDFSETVVTNKQGTITELQVYIAGAEGAGSVSQFRQRYSERGGQTGVFSTLWHFGRERFHGALYSLFALNIAGVAENIAGCFRAIAWAFRYHFIYCIIFAAAKLAVISVAAGAICRIAALQFARGEKPGLMEALRFGAKKFLSLFTAPLVPLGIIIFIGVFVFLLGLIGNIPAAGELIMGIFMPLAFLAGSLIAVVLIGTVAGFNLMFPAVAYDGSDCFDAISRSFNYVYSRPWRMGFYTAVAAVYGAICYVFVRFFAFLLLAATYALLDIGIFGQAGGASKLARVWTRPTFVSLAPGGEVSMNWSEGFAAFLIQLFLLVVVGLVISFIISFYFSANTIIYSLMRNRVDNTALEDVYTLPQEAEAEPTTAETESEESQPESSPTE